MEAYYQSPIGVLKICGDENGISEILFTEKNNVIDNSIPDCLSSCFRQLDDFFNYKRIDFDLKLNLNGTDFQKLVWLKVADIPFGKTVSYMDIALKVGGKDIIRAVGNAIGKNLINIVIPCHRVIGTNGKLTGYRGGLRKKEWLLNFENNVKQGNLFYNTNYKLL
ncbi:MAG: methylated-DNA--[protein]-cysteine S-methyltransferase [Chlorobi bacterium]|nr:methylated-DNA--[protein]-cysteine S-methyltransferase [Chlorobiota bacterium]